MAQAMENHVDERVLSSLDKYFNEETPNNDIMVNLRMEAMRYQRWYFWHHISTFDQLVILLSRMGLTLWKSEEEWAINLMGKGNATFIGEKEFSTIIREIHNLRQAMDINDLTFPRMEGQPHQT